jgi:D-glycero-D-manno-heptose 1,7-bisphosphate phosphatase
LNVSSLHHGAPSLTARRAVFLDRDGVLIENRSTYVRSVADMAVLPTTGRAMRRLGQTDLAIVMITNQSAIGRGLTSHAEVDRVNAALSDEIALEGGRLDACYVCPHVPRDRCGCRKPAPGLLRAAAKDMALDLDGSFLVGDASSDIEAAAAVGVLGILVLTGRGSSQRMGMAGQLRCLVADDLVGAVDLILASIGGAPA